MPDRRLSQIFEQEVAGQKPSGWIGRSFSEQKRAVWGLAARSAERQKIFLKVPFTAVTPNQAEPGCHLPFNTTLQALGRAGEGAGP